MGRSRDATMVILEVHTKGGKGVRVPLIPPPFPNPKRATAKVVP
jgi:hypothetical protein